MKAKFVFGAMFAAALFVPISAKAYDAAGAQQYLLAHSSSPWSTMALQVLGVATIPTDALKNISSPSAIDYEAPILAITAIGQDPKTFGGSDYIATLESFHTGGQIGDPTTVNDDIFGILALLSAGVPASDINVSDSQAFILAHQNSDGGWGYAVSATSDSNTTASAIVALRAAGLPTSDSHIQSALAYLKTSQNTDGGFTYDPNSSFGTASDSSSTAWSMWALTSANQTISDWTVSGHTPTDYLSGNQDAAGFFTYQQGSGEDSFSPVTTAYAVIALAGKSLPLSANVSNIGGGGGGGLPATADLNVKITEDNGGTGTVTSSDGRIHCGNNPTGVCTFPYIEGTTLSLTATPDQGSTFTDTWFGDCTGNNLTCTITVDSEKNVTAHFSKPAAAIVATPETSVGTTDTAAPSGSVLGDSTQTSSSTPSPVMQQAPAKLPRTGMPTGLLAIILGVSASFVLGENFWQRKKSGLSV